MAIHKIASEMTLISAISESDVVDLRILELTRKKQEYLNHIAKIIAQFPIGMVMQRKRQNNTWEIIDIQARTTKLITAKQLIALPEIFVTYKLKKIEKRKNAQVIKTIMVNQSSLKENFVKYLNGDRTRDQDYACPYEIEQDYGRIW